MNFTVTGGNKNASFSLTENKIGDILFLAVNMTLPEAEIPEPFFIKFNFSAADCYSTWNPSLLDIHGLAFDWSKLTVKSRLASWMPVQSLISKNGTNKLCIAVSDVDTPISIKTGICEENATFACEIEFFTLPTAPADSYKAIVRLDMRAIPYYDSIYETAGWWETECGYESAYVPEAAKMPMDSLGTAFIRGLTRMKL